MIDLEFLFNSILESNSFLILLYSSLSVSSCCCSLRVLSFKSITRWFSLEFSFIFIFNTFSVNCLHMIVTEWARLVRTHCYLVDMATVMYLLFLKEFIVLKLSHLQLRFTQFSIVQLHLPFCHPSLGLPQLLSHLLRFIHFFLVQLR